jgi:hypothetical protein
MQGSSDSASSHGCYSEGCDAADMCGCTQFLPCINEGSTSDAYGLFDIYDSDASKCLLMQALGGIPDENCIKVLSMLHLQPDVVSCGDSCAHIDLTGVASVATHD